MKTIDNKIKDEVIKLIEYVLEPIEGKVVSVGDSYKTTLGSQIGDKPWKKWVEIIYPIFITTKLGEESLLLNFTHLNRWEDVTWVACHNLLYTKHISEENDRNNILERLHSQKFLKLIKG